MALATYTVKRGDSLWKICSGGCGSNVASSISGNSINAKIDTLVRLNNIANRNLIYVGQVLKLCDSSQPSHAPANNTNSNSSSNNTEKDYGVPKITTLALGASQCDPNGNVTQLSSRTVVLFWDYDRPNIKNYQISWDEHRKDVNANPNTSGAWWHDNSMVQETDGNGLISRRYIITADDLSDKIKVKVRPISDTYKDKDGNEKKYFDNTNLWSAEKIYDFADNPPSPPPVPSIEIKDYTLKIHIDNIDYANLGADSIEFEIVKNNVSSIGTYSANINKNLRYVEYSKVVDAGAEYKVRARSKKGSKVSGWSDFSSNAGTKPSKVQSITICKAIKYDATTPAAYIEWSKVSNADSYEIEYATNINYFDKTDQTTIISDIKDNKRSIIGLEQGKEYFFRVRAANQNGESEWSDIRSCIIGTKPAPPTTWSSTTTAIVGEDLYLYWVHNSQDNSSETVAQLDLYIGDTKQNIPPIYNTKSEEDKDKTSVYRIDTNKYSQGTVIRWKVKTAGIVATEFSDWSVERTITIYAKPTLALAVTTKPNGGGSRIEQLKTFPFYIQAMASPQTQNPIGYQLRIISNEYYETIDETGRNKIVNKGDEVYSKHFDINNALSVELSAGDIDLEGDIEYTVHCLVTMNSGLTAESSHDFTVKWQDVYYNIDADVVINQDNLTASITPYSLNENGSLVEDLTLSVYRREFDGSLTEIATGIPNTNSMTVTDPHPALDYARYRIVGRTISTGAISFHDLPGIKVGGIAVVIQWDEEWSTFESSDEYQPEKPPWSGSMLLLPYNIDVSDSHKVDSELIEYIGRKHPVAYFGTQLGESASWNVEIPKEDKETLYAIRRLSIWTGIVYVREPSGSGYWANISVSYSQTHNATIIPVSFEITRVEGGM